MKVKTCLRFPGGKFYGFKQIKPFLMIEHYDNREPFFGGGSVFLGKKLTKNLNWINDIDKELITFYKVIQNNKTRKKLYEMLKNEVASKERHAKVKSMKPKNGIEVAFKFFYLNRTSFSGIMVKPRWGYLLGSSVTPDRWIKIIEPVASKLQDVKITCLDFREVIKTKSKNNVLIYLDPPYFRASKSIYKNEFTDKNHFNLCELLKKTPFKFVLSYENNGEIKKMYNWAHIHELNWVYFMSEGRRQEGKELIITNFEIGLKKFSK